MGDLHADLPALGRICRTRETPWRIKASSLDQGILHSFNLDYGLTVEVSTSMIVIHDLTSIFMIWVITGPWFCDREGLGIIQVHVTCDTDRRHNFPLRTKGSMYIHCLLEKQSRLVHAFSDDSKTWKAFWQLLKCCFWRPPYSTQKFACASRACHVYVFIGLTLGRGTLPQQWVD